MHKGTIINHKVWLRSGCAQRANNRVRFLKPGERIHIKSAVFGEKCEGINLWYRLVSGEYVWSGCVAIDGTGPTPGPKKIIFNADDYGVIPSINEGVVRGIREGMLRSVSCLMNYKDSKDNLLELVNLQNGLKNTENPLELGAHLTITSGSPLKGDEVSVLGCIDKGKLRFRDFKKLNRYYRNLSGGLKDEFLKALKIELQAQLDVFHQAGVRIDHLDSHHNSLLFQPEFYQIFLEIAQENGIKKYQRGIPVRSIINYPKGKDNFYMKYAAKQLFHTDAYIKALKNQYCHNDMEVPNSPGLLHSNHYGPLPQVAISRMGYKRVLRNKKKKIPGMYLDLTSSHFETMEFLLHLRHGSVRFNNKDYKNEVDDIGYNGIDHRAFDSRTAELDSFLSLGTNFKDLPNRIEVDKWANIAFDQPCAL